MKVFQRVVSLCPSTTELVCRLGGAGQLVGRTRYCHHPAECLEGVPAVGGTKNPDLDRIEALAPDLVLLNAEENRWEDAEALVARDIPVDVGTPATPEQVREYVERLGRLLALEANAAELSRAIGRKAEVVRSEARSFRPWRFLCLVWRKPWMAVAPGTYISSLLETAGGWNAVEQRSGDRYPAIAEDALRRLEVDRVLLPSEPFPFSEKHRAELVRATGWREERLVFVDGEDLCWHGWRTLRGLDLALELARQVACDSEPTPAWRLEAASREVRRT